jgi:hypothetical protein
MPAENATLSHLPQTVSQCWYTSPRFRRTTLLLLLLVACIEGAFAIFFRKNDFLLHVYVGQAFLEGVPYGRSQAMYPVGRSLMNALLAIAPLRLTRAVCFLLALLAIWACYRTWSRLAQSAAPAPQAVTTAAALLTALGTLAYMLRDLDECGLQLYLLFFLSAAASALSRGRSAWTGFWLATAVTYKVTPFLFFPLLLGKRQWRAAGWMVLFLAFWALAPVLFVGPGKTIAAHQSWLTHTRWVMANRQAYPEQIGEPQRPDNLALAALLARNLQTYPPGHPLYVDHPLVVQPGGLGPQSAYLTVRSMLLALGLALAWCFRRPWPTAAESGRMGSEWAAVCLLSAILSPICWKQHLVLVLPALFLVIRTTLAQGPFSRWRIVALVSIGGIINLTRDSFVG